MLEVSVSTSQIKSLLSDAIREARDLERKHGGRIWDGNQNSWGGDTEKGKDIKNWFNKYLNRMESTIGILNTYAGIKFRSRFLTINRDVDFWSELIREMEAFPMKLEELVRLATVRGNAERISNEMDELSLMESEARRIQGIQAENKPSTVQNQEPLIVMNRGSQCVAFTEDYFAKTFPNGQGMVNRLKQTGRMQLGEGEFAGWTVSWITRTSDILLYTTRCKLFR